MPTRADSIGLSLARALDGGPKEDAALGAIDRLDKAIAQHVGTKRATVNVPLKRLVERAETADAQLDAERARLRAQDALRRRLDERREHCGALATALHGAELNVRDLRAGVLQTRLAGLREISRPHCIAFAGTAHSTTTSQALRQRGSRISMRRLRAGKSEMPLWATRCAPKPKAA